MPLSQDVNLHLLRRFFLASDTEVSRLPQDIALDDEDTINHVKNVLRLKPGDHIVTIVPDTRTAYLAVLKSLDKKRLAFTLTDKVESPEDRLAPVTLGCALVKEQRWDVLIQKTTELGVSIIVPLETERTVVQVKDPAQKQERWQQVAKHAAEQSEGLFIPEIQKPMDVGAFCKATSAFGLKLFPDERPGKHRVPLREALRKFPTPSAVVGVIGPEGGWTESERQCFLDHGFTAVSLGSRILRTETAATSLMSALRYEYDD